MHLCDATTFFVSTICAAVGICEGMATLGEKVVKAREAMGWTQGDLAVRLGMTQQGIAAIENGKSERPKKLRELARALLLTEEYLLDEADLPEPEVPADYERTQGQRVSSIIPARELEVQKLMPVFSGAQGGQGKLIIGSDPIDRVKMPAFLENVAGAYGLLIDGDSMIPAFYPGDTALVNPHLRPQRGRNVILYHNPPGGEDAEAIIKQLNGWSDREWDLEQWNPHKQFKEFRKEWPICHRVVGKYDAT